MSTIICLTTAVFTLMSTNTEGVQNNWQKCIHALFFLPIFREEPGLTHTVCPGVLTPSSNPALGQFGDSKSLAAAKLLADTEVDAIGWSATSSGWLGFEIMAERHLGICVDHDFAPVEPEALRELIKETSAARPQAISTFCTNLPAAGADLGTVHGWGRLYGWR